MDYAGSNNGREGCVFGSPIIDPAGWYAEVISKRNEWIHEFNDSEINEFDKAVHTYGNTDENLVALGSSGFYLPTLLPRVNEIRKEILYGRGFVLFRGFLVERVVKLSSALSFWAFGQYLGDGALSQNKYDHALGHVTDLGESKRNRSQRGPYSC